MKFGLIHRLMTGVLAVLGLLALVTSGELSRAMSVTIVLGLALALAVPERWQERPALRHFATVATLLLVFVQVVRLAAGAAFLPAVVELAAALQVVRLATRRGAAHDQQVIVLALVHLIAGTVLGGGLAYGLCFLGFLVVAPGALVLSHLRREVEGNYRQGARDRTGLPVDVPRILRSRRVIGKQFLLFTCSLSIPIFLFTAVLFVLFPRVGLSFFLNRSRPERMIGFSDHVDLGGVGRLRNDPTLALRVMYPDLPAEPPPRLALYLRGNAFDAYDGRSWQRSDTRRVGADRSGSQVRITRYAQPGIDRKMTLDLEPIEPPVLFVPADAIAIQLAPRGTAAFGMPAVTQSSEGQLSYLGADDRGLRYDVYLAGASEPPARPLRPEERVRYLALPSLLTARVAELARSWVGTETRAAEQAKLVEQHLRTEFKYDLESPSSGRLNPLEDFLFESKRGHCEFYSTAMAMLLRTLDVPTRNVTGFIGGSYNRFGRYYAVRQGDAHSWVEVYVDGKGWTRFDPTPPADAAPQSEVTGALAFMRDLVEATAQNWNHHVVGYDLKQQVGILSWWQTRYDRVATRSAILQHPRRLLVFLGGASLLLYAAYWLWLHRRARAGTPERRAEQEAAAAVREATALYRTLESAMTARGAARQPGTPPLAHARALCEIGHPLGAEALALTQLYVEARFGGRVLGVAERRDFTRRVRALRHARDAAPRLAA